MAVTGSFNTTGYVDPDAYYTRRLHFSWTRASYDMAANTSTIKFILKATGGAGGYVVGTAITLVVDGEIVYTSPTGLKVYKDQELYRGEMVLKHDSNGERSLNVSVSGGLYYRGNVSGDGTWMLDPLTRYATIVSAPSFNDLANPILVYKNPMGTAVTSIEACISLTGSKDDIPYREVSATGSSYTFNLSEEERNILRNATTANSRKIYFYLKTVADGTTYYSSLAKTFTVTDAHPLVENITIRDGYYLTEQLTGDVEKLIKFYSTASVNYTFAGQKGASITSYKVIVGNDTIEAIPANFPYNEIDTFTIEVTDSRGNVTTKTITKDLVPYVKLTCNLSGNRPDANGNMTVSVHGNYFNGSFGAVDNTLSVQYRIKKKDEDWSAWTDMTPTFGNGTYSAETELSGLESSTLYIFQARAIDKLATVESAEREGKSTPVFDWGEEDFNFNVPVNMNGQTVLRHNEAANNLVVSASGGFIYFRPGGTSDTSAEVKINPQGAIELSGDIIINGQSLKALLGID